MIADSGKKPLNIDNLKDVIREWKFAWMDIKGTDERDRKNYHRRAFGVDANMMHNLATRIESAFTPCPNCERLERPSCQAGCTYFDGGEKRHDRNCIHYPESRTKMYDDALVEITRLKAQLAMCKEALEFYACKDNYLTRFISMSCGCCSTEKEPEVLEDVDNIAAACLAKLEESDGEE